MSWHYDVRTDRLTGHDYPGVLSNGWPQYELDELEVGARAAHGLDEEDQWWWALIGDQLAAEEGR